MIIDTSMIPKIHYLVGPALATITYISALYWVTGLDDVGLMRAMFWFLLAIAGAIVTGAYISEALITGAPMSDDEKDQAIAKLRAELDKARDRIDTLDPYRRRSR